MAVMKKLSIAFLAAAALMAQPLEAVHGHSRDGQRKRSRAEVKKERKHAKAVRATKKAQGRKFLKKFTAYLAKKAHDQRLAARSGIVGGAHTVRSVGSFVSEHPVATAFAAGSALGTPAFGTVLALNVAAALAVKSAVAKLWHSGVLQSGAESAKTALLGELEAIKAQYASDAHTQAALARIQDVLREKGLHAAQEELAKMEAEEAKAARKAARTAAKAKREEKAAKAKAEEKEAVSSDEDSDEGEDVSSDEDSDASSVSSDEEEVKVPAKRAKHAARKKAPARKRARVKAATPKPAADDDDATADDEGGPAGRTRSHKKS